MKLFKNEVGRPSNETLKKRKMVIVGVVVLVICLAIGGGIFVKKAFFSNGIEGAGKNASSGFYCKIHNAYGNTKKLKGLSTIYTYGECHSNPVKFSSITTYYMDKNNKTIYAPMTVATGFNNRTVNTRMDVSSSVLDRILSVGYLKKSQGIVKVKICAKDRRGYITCSKTSTLKFS